MYLCIRNLKCMMKQSVILILLCLSVAAQSANCQVREKGDSIYNRLVELSLRDSVDRLQAEKDAALSYFSANEQWDHYYFLTSSMRHPTLLYPQIRQVK